MVSRIDEKKSLVSVSKSLKIRLGKIMIIGFDPGRDKCGIALINEDREIVFKKVVNSQSAIATIQQTIEKYQPLTLVMGNQTTAKEWEKKLREDINLGIVLIDEQNSSAEARIRYWDFNPPRGLQKLIPQGLRIPPDPIDDIVAVILIERYWQKQLKMT